MRFSENRKLAWIILALCICLSIFGFGEMSIAREYGKAMDIFISGTDKSLSMRHSIDSYLDWSAGAARIMTAEAEIYLDDEALIDEIDRLASQISDEDDLAVRYQAYEDLKFEIDKLYNSVYKAAENSFADFKIAYDDFWGYENMIRFDGYHEAARDYNETIKGFPGSLVAKIFGKGDLHTFEG